MAPISQSILASMPEEIEPEEEGARPFLDLDKLRSDANRVVQVRRTVAKIQQKKQGVTEDVAAELSATDLSSRQLRLKELAGALPRFDALIAAKISQAPLIDPTLSRQISQVVPTIAAANLALKSLGTAVLPGPLIDPAFQRQMSKLGPLIDSASRRQMSKLGPLIDSASRRQMSKLGPLIDSASRRQMSKLGPLIDSASRRQMSKLGPLIDSALWRQMSQFGQTLAALNSVLNNQVAESLSLWLREYSRSIRIAFPPPDPLLSDIIDALDKDPSAAERLALRISWQPDQWQRECIRLKARFEGSSPDEVRKKALSQGVISALCWEKEDEVPIQIGPQSKWLYDGQQHLATVLPMHIPIQLLWKWIQEEAARAAGLWLVDYPYAPSVVLEAPPDQSGHWQLARFTLPPTEEQSLTTRRGRPYGSGIFEDGQAFLQEIRLAVAQVHGRGSRVTQERVAEVMSQRGFMGSSGADRQLRFWVKEFGFAGWKDLLRSL